MRGTGPTAWVARRRGGRDELGLMTLEWLLVIAAIAGVAAVTAYVVQRVVDEEVKVGEDPAVRMLDAEIAAAFVVEESYGAALAEAAASPAFRPDDPAFVAPFRTRCAQLATAGRFDDVVVGANFEVDANAAAPYRCVLRFRVLPVP